MKKHEQLTDAEIVNEFKEGRTELFDEIVSRYASRMYPAAYGILGNKQDSEEVVQDAFVRAYKSMNEFRGDSALETWLHRIVVNLSRNKYHWNRRRGAGLNVSISGNDSLEIDGETKEMNIPDKGAVPDAMLENLEMEKRLQEGFEKLPESLKEAMVLRHMNDMPYDKISDVLGCKIGTVKSKLARGREILWNFISSGL